MLANLRSVGDTCAMTFDSSSPTPFEEYQASRDRADFESNLIAERITDTKAFLRAQENDLEASKRVADNLSTTFFDQLVKTGGLYGATFELECKEGLELPKDLRKAEKANFVARQLLRLNDVLVEAGQPVPVLVMRARSDTFTSCETGLSYPRPDEICEREEQWLEAELFQAVPSEGLAIKYAQKQTLFKGVLKSVVGIDMLVTSERNLWVTRGGMDHDTWISGPYTKKMEHLDAPSKHNIYADISRTQSEVIVDADWLPEGAVSGVFADAAAIAKVYDNAKKLPVLGPSARKLGEMLNDYGLDV